MEAASFCEQTLESIYTLIDGRKDGADCGNLIEEFYIESPFEGQLYQGYRDYYMNMAGYIRVVTNMALTVTSTYQTLQSKKSDEWK